MENGMGVSAVSDKKKEVPVKKKRKEKRGRATKKEVHR